MMVKDPRKLISENCFKPINFVKKANYYLRKKSKKKKKSVLLAPNLTKKYLTLLKVKNIQKMFLIY